MLGKVQFECKCFEVAALISLEGNSGATFLGSGEGQTEIGRSQVMLECSNT